MKFFHKLFNTKKYQEEVKQKEMLLNKFKSVSLQDWLLRIPEGSYCLGRNNWIHIEREDNLISLHSTTDRETTNRGIRKSFILKYDSEGLVSCYFQIRAMWPSYQRGYFYKDRNNDPENKEITKSCINFALCSIIENGHRFYDLPMIDFDGTIKAEVIEVNYEKNESNMMIPI
tara:strand:+ start:7379 stop:7897 length:519 start_codon:yes stop_codon:yes gene_type:complete